MENLEKTKKVTYYKIQISGHFIECFFKNDQIHHLEIMHGLPAGAVLFSIQKDERFPETWNMIFIENQQYLKYNNSIQHIELKPIIRDLEKSIF